MPELYEYVHTPERDLKYYMPYTPAIKVTGGQIAYLAGVTAAPIYHSHPHVKEEFDEVPLDPEAQASLCLENLQKVLAEMDADLTNIVELTIYMVDQGANQRGVGQAMRKYFGDHRPASTSVEIVRLATDPRLILELKAVAVVPA